MAIEAGQVLVPIGIAARRLDISRERLRVLVDTGRARAVRDSTGRRFLEAREVERLLEARRLKLRGRDPAGSNPGTPFGKGADRGDR